MLRIARQGPAEESPGVRRTPFAEELCHQEPAGGRPLAPGEEQIGGARSSYRGLGRVPSLPPRSH